MPFKCCLIFITSWLMSFQGMTSEVISFQNDNNIAPSIHIRTLASSCAACHGTFGNSARGKGSSIAIPTLAGINNQYFIAQMLAFKTGKREPLIMQRHAQGLTVDEINALGVYFSKQTTVAPAHLKPQNLDPNHAH